MGHLIAGRWGKREKELVREERRDRVWERYREVKRDEGSETENTKSVFASGRHESVD